MAEKIWQALTNELATSVTEAGRSVVGVQGRRHPSSGVVFGPETIVTVNHGLRRDEDITVIRENGERISARVAGRDPGTDLAVLRLAQAISAPTPRWGDATKLRIGEVALAVARTWRGNIVATSGIISGLMAGPWRTWQGGELDEFIRPDLTLYPGFSGGPLITSGGGFIGINTAGLHRWGITVPAATLVRVAEELAEKGRVERPYLGLAMQRVVLPESLKSKLNLTSSECLLIVHVSGDSPAEKAGMMLGDILIELEGKAVIDTDDVQETLRSAGLGRELEAAVIRGGSPLKFRVKLEARPRVE